MLCNSPSILSSTSSPFTSSLSSNSLSPSRVLHCSITPPIRKIRASSKATVDDGSPEMFTQNNTIADFMRFKSGGGTAAELQTAVVTYRKKFPWSLLRPFLKVDLVSTIHIADKDYFATLQKELESYDCVLYEMVASRESLETRRNTTPPKLQSASRGFNILGFIQRLMANVLTLDFQLDCIDYRGNNWYHADLDYETFKQLQLEKGESLFTFARDMTLRSTKALVQPFLVPKEPSDPWTSKLLWVSRAIPMPLLGLVIIGSVCADTESTVSKFPELKALSRLDFGAAMKVFLARRLTTEFTLVTADIEEKSVVIGERNKAATEALRRAINNGNNKIAILYGGGHMPDLGRRLKDEFELVPSDVQWLTAWTIENRNLSSSTLPILGKIAEISGWPLNRYQTMALFLFSSVLALDLLFWELFVDTTVNWVSHVAFDVSQYLESAGVI